MTLNIYSVKLAEPTLLIGPPPPAPYPPTTFRSVCIVVSRLGRKLFNTRASATCRRRKCAFPSRRSNPDCCFFQTLYQSNSLSQPYYIKQSIPSLGGSPSRCTWPGIRLHHAHLAFNHQRRRTHRWGAKRINQSIILCFFFQFFSLCTFTMNSSH